ncbi:MAG: efflux RND transporter periplasmic adaptor subunit [Candidatus Omnitrophica bacterium]|nr:efflux RND transporter periplasmic adaptor subunit [Candidatus Omnitrophota bacterium]MCG2704946.1 efflux RND transporter periplasmic adaptor subunit [Candidatus Omnitrophota bacterium]
MNLFKTELFKNRKRLIILSILLIGIFTMWGWTSLSKKLAGGANLIKELISGSKADKSGGEELSEPPIPVRTEKVVKTDYVDSIVSFGTIKGFQEIPVKFEEAARIYKFYFKEGEPIKKGDLVVSEEQEEQKWKVEYAEIEYNKNRTLYDLGAITKDKLRQAELELEVAKESLNKRNFYAPSDGFIGTRWMKEGEVASPNEIVTTFVEIGNIFCEAGVIEKDMDKVETGQKASIIIEAFPAKNFEGVVDSVSPILEGRSRTQTVRILVPNEKGLIKPGMFAKADITIFEKKDAIVIPRKALQKTDEGYAVFGVVRPEGEAKKTPAGFDEATAKVISVKVDRTGEERALIGEGLTEGEEIIIETPEAKSSIKDGAKIEIMPERGE